MEVPERGEPPVILVTLHVPGKRQHRVLLMRKAFAFVPLLLTAFSACLDTPTDPNCGQVPTLVTETRGDTMVTVTGLRYIDTRVGTGARAQACRGSSITYRGSLLDGTEFDRGTLDPIIPGQGVYLAAFEQGVVGMKVGGERRLILPPSMGYGRFPPQGSGIPVNAVLVFDIGLTGTE